jgi:2-dehydropantoate 2-reductase
LSGPLFGYAYSRQNRRGRPFVALAKARVIADRFGPKHVVGCALKVATTLDDDGRVIQLNMLQDLAYGELDGEVAPRIQALDEFMKGAEISARLSGAIRREMWEKWILLAAT